MFSDSKDVQSTSSVRLELLAFGIARDLVGSRHFSIELESPATVALLRSYLLQRFPGLGHLRSLGIAVNECYASDDLELRPDDEIVLIPPVSGG